MNYKEQLRAELEPMLAALPDEDRRKVMAFVTAKVYESYLNGRESASKGARSKMAE